MLLSLIYHLICRALSTGHRPMDDRDVELLVLRHQVKVLRRQVKRPCFQRSDRLFLAAASRRLPRPRWSAFIVEPETLLRWHRELVRRKWTFRRKHRGGRPGLDALTTDLIVHLARENPRWGYQRIRGELLKLDVRLSASTIRTVLLRHGLGPAPRRSGPKWSGFLASQAQGIARAALVLGACPPRVQLVHAVERRAMQRTKVPRTRGPKPPSTGAWTRTVELGLLEVARGREGDRGHEG
jgi:hypothetical protein